MRRGGIIMLAMIGLLAVLGSSKVLATEADPGFSTKELIERLTRIETRLENLQLQINGLQQQIGDNQKNLQQQIGNNQKNLQQQIGDLKVVLSDLKNFVMWGFGVMIMGMFALVSFVIWDRRTALSPTMNQVDDLRRRERDLEDVLRRYAFQEPKLAEILKSSGLL